MDKFAIKFAPIPPSESQDVTNKSDKNALRVISQPLGVTGALKPKMYSKSIYFPVFYIWQLLNMNAWHFLVG